MLILFVAVIAIIMFLAFYRIFEKAGYPGRKGLIPVYNLWYLVKIARKPKSYFIRLFVISNVGYYIYELLSEKINTRLLMGTLNGSISPVLGAILGGVLSLGGLVILIIGLVYNYRLSHALAKNFGKSKGFGFGLFILAPIYYPKLAFGSSEYITNKTKDPSTQQEKLNTPEDSLKNIQDKQIQIKQEMLHIKEEFTQLKLVLQQNPNDIVTKNKLLDLQKQFNAYKEAYIKLSQ